MDSTAIPRTFAGAWLWLPHPTHQGLLTKAPSPSSPAGAARIQTGNFETALERSFRVCDRSSQTSYNTLTVPAIYRLSEMTTPADLTVFTASHYPGPRHRCRQTTHQPQSGPLDLNP